MPARAWKIAFETYHGWMAHKAPRLGAALAYYTALSLAPLLLVVIAVGGFAFGEEAARGQIVGQLRGLVGDDGARAIQDLLQSARRPASGIVATGIGIATLLVGATGVFSELQDALNTIWEVRPRPDRSWGDVLRERFLSFAMVVGSGFLLLVSLVVSAVIASLGGPLHALGPGAEAVSHAIVSILSVVAATIIFALVFKVLPDTDIAWRDVWTGSIVTALLFSIGKLAIGFYLGRASIGSTYGAAGSFVVLLVWVYYSAQILLLGAEFTQVMAQRRRVGDNPG